MKKIFLLRCLSLLFGVWLCSFSVSFAQMHEISGKAINIENGQPISNLTIQIKGTEFKCKTNELGEYKLFVPDSISEVEFVEIPGIKINNVVKPSENEFDLMLSELSLQDLFSLSLDELLNVKVSIATLKSVNLYESPGIISIITENEIVKSGARDLMDVLRRLPGFSFGIDAVWHTGMGLRGNWAFEGKTLLMVDGVEMNELLGGTVALGRRFDMCQVKRIEIIRGPGSSIYGGFAELCVINIITKIGEELSGGNVVASFNTTDSGLAGFKTGVAFGDKNETIEYAVKAHLSRSQRSNNVFYDLKGNAKDLDLDSGLLSSHINSNIKIKDLSARFIYDRYTTKSYTLFTDLMNEKTKTPFINYLVELKYDLKLKNVVITPRFDYLFQRPWYNEDLLGSKINFQRLRGNVNFSYAHSEHLNFISGLEYFNEKSKNELSSVKGYYHGGVDELSYNSFSIYAQSYLKTKYFNLTVGGRYLYHNHFGDAFAPRVGLTKTFSKFYSKLLFNKSFRPPTTFNIGVSPDIKPDKSKVVEFEFGYNPSEKFRMSINLFDIKIDKPITYSYIDELGYYNFNKTGSRGVEFDSKLKTNWGEIMLNYSYYNSKDKNEVDFYVVENHEKLLLGFPSHKVNVGCNIYLSKGITLNANLNYLSEKYAYTTIDQSGKPMQSKLSPSTLVDLYLNWNNFVSRNLKLGVGIYNVFNDAYKFVQPYNGGHAPLPGMNREFSLRLTYLFDFKD